MFCDRKNNPICQFPWDSLHTLCWSNAAYGSHILTIVTLGIYTKSYLSSRLCIKYCEMLLQSQITILQPHIQDIYLEDSLRNCPHEMPQDLTDDCSTLVQVMAWCYQATSYYMSQCCPSPMTPYGAITTQWFKCTIETGPVHDHTSMACHPYHWFILSNSF